MAVGCSSAETNDRPDIVEVKQSEELDDDMYYYHYDPKTGKEGSESVGGSNFKYNNQCSILSRK